MTEPLSYEELQTNEIRLIELLPNKAGAQVECRLSTVSLDNLPSYEALSYVWGDASATAPIVCDGCTMQVTVSLATALRRLRNAEEGLSRLLWADALSIDQSNLVEKSIQVPLMTRIYSAATRVVVYMGQEDTKPVLTAVAAIEYVASTYKTCREKSVDPAAHLGFSDLEARIQESGHENVWSSLNAFFTIPYWERVWCVQELNLARSASFIIGSTELSRASITSFVLWYSRRFILEMGKGVPFDNTLKPGTASKAALMLNYREMTLIHMEDLCSILDNFRYARATNLSDKVYGLLGIHTHITGLAPPINVDYGKSVEQVYMDTALHSINTTRNLDVLSYIEHGPQFDSSSAYPSWVPRWDRAESPGYMRMLDPKTTLSAARREPAISPFPVANLKALPVQGVVFDQACRVSEILPGVSWLEQAQDFRFLFAQFWFEVNGRSESKRQLSDVELALTLTGGLGVLDKGTGLTGKEDPSETVEEIDSEHGCRFMAYFYSFVRKMGLPAFGNDASQQDSGPYSMRAGAMCGTRRIFRTSGGSLGLGPGCMQAGDLVAVLDGGKVPYVLRHLEGGFKFAFMGECFVYAIRNGEAYDMAEKQGLRKQSLELV